VTDQLKIFDIHHMLQKKMGIQWDSTSAVCRVQESPCFSEEGSIVQYSHRVWNPHVISPID
jgi:hypothetical protein